MGERPRANRCDDEARRLLLVALTFGVLLLILTSAG